VRGRVGWWGRPGAAQLRGPGGERRAPLAWVGRSCTPARRPVVVAWRADETLAEGPRRAGWGAGRRIPGQAAESPSCRTRLADRGGQLRAGSPGPRLGARCRRGTTQTRCLTCSMRHIGAWLARVAGKRTGSRTFVHGRSVNGWIWERGGYGEASGARVWRGGRVRVPEVAQSDSSRGGNDSRHQSSAICRRAPRGVLAAEGTGALGRQPGADRTWVGAEDVAAWPRVRLRHVGTSSYR
jgi:hypothetical protein